MPKHIRSKKEGKKGKGKEDREEEEDVVEEDVVVDGSNVQRSEDPQPTNGYYRIKEGVCGIWIDKNSGAGIHITTDPPTNYVPGDTGWAFIPVTEGIEIFGHAVFYLCYPS